ncbi:MAG: type I-D CRISPR-associated protein Cas7/Csc2 [Thermoprotei archaeon]|nr:MAG: type I-D CRISPR-associated protein Cas7/Csc2 [Thermoprotei archaeon]
MEYKNLDEIVEALKVYTGRPEDIVLRGKVVNVFIAFKALEPLLTRTEGQGDITTFLLNNISVPAILNTKVQGMLRRKTLQILRNYWPEGKPLCYVLVQAKKGKGEIKGYCGACPSCLIYGYAVQEERTYNVKSRVEGDVYYGTIPEEEATFEFTRNAVDEITHTTGQALLTERAVKPGVIFIGKMALRNLTPSELKLVLYTLASLDRLGAVQTHFGRIKPIILGLIGAHYEIGSGYEIVSQILADGLKEEDKILAKARELIKEVGAKYGGTTVVQEALEDIVLKADIKTICDEAWKDAQKKKKELDEVSGVSK